MLESESTWSVVSSGCVKIVPYFCEQSESPSTFNTPAEVQRGTFCGLMARLVRVVLMLWSLSWLIVDLHLILTALNFSMQGTVQEHANSGGRCSEVCSVAVPQV